MKPQWLIGPLALGLGILIGRTSLAPSPPDKATAAQAGNERARSARGSRDGPLQSVGAFAGLSSEIQRAPAVRMPALLRRALTHPEPVERRELVVECLRAMDAGNWQEMFAQFEAVSRETGMVHDVEWGMALMVAGRCGGREAAEHFRGRSGKQLREVIWGWAQSEPQAALSWLDEAASQDPSIRQSNLSVALGGAAQAGGIDAMRILDELPLEDRIRCVGDFGWNLAQRDGFDAAIEWMAKTSASCPPGEEAYAAAVADHVIGRLRDNAKNHWAARPAADAMARILTADPGLESHLPGVLAQLPAGQPFEFLSQLSQSGVGRGAMAGGIGSQLDVLVSNRPDEAAKWIEAHPDDPLAPRVLERLR